MKIIKMSAFQFENEFEDPKGGIFECMGYAGNMIRAVVVDRDNGDKLGLANLNFYKFRGDVKLSNKKIKYFVPAIHDCIKNKMIPAFYTVVLLKRGKNK